MSDQNDSEFAAINQLLSSGALNPPTLDPSWISDFNELRRFVAHPLKAHVAKYELTEQELTRIADADAKAAALLMTMGETD